MNSVIYQLEMSEEEIKTAFLTPCVLRETNFTTTVADFLKDSSVNERDNYNRIKEFIKYINEKTDKISVNIENDKCKSIIFKKGFKHSYFEKSFNLFKNISLNLTLEQFIKPFDSDIFQIQNLLDSDYYYIYNEGEYIKIGEFLRTVQEDEKYYFGGTVLYHF